MLRRTLWAVMTPLVAAALLVLPWGEWATGDAARTTTVRVGYVASLLNAPVIVGLDLGLFQEALGEVSIETHMFGAGPALIEGLFAGAIDIAYVGPNPAINAWIRSNGQAIRIVAGSTVGGSGFVVPQGWAPTRADDFVGRTIATPQIGNTQDISLRHYLYSLGVSEAGKQDAMRVISAAGPEMYSMFIRGEIDGAWVVEPWLTRLLSSAGGQLWVHEDEMMQAYVAVRPDFLVGAPDLVEAWLRVHVSISEWLNRGDDRAAIVANALSDVWQQSISVLEVSSALERLRFEWQVSALALEELAERAFTLGFLGQHRSELAGLVVSEPLERALQTHESSPRAKGMSGK